MSKLAMNLPLQEMISRVIDGAITKTASDDGTKDKVKRLVAEEKREHGHIPSAREEREEHTKTASANSATSPAFVEKLASALDHIAENLDSIEFPHKGLIAQAAEKLANDGSPAGAGKGPGALEVLKSIGGEQKYKKDKPKGEDAAASTHGTPLSTGGLPGSKTQMENDMHDAPGGGKVAPTATYPEKGPLVAGPSVKHASPRDLYKQAILAKLAGEDVMKANIDGGGTTSPLAGEGQLESMKSGESGPGGSGNHLSGDGNQARRLIQSNQAAIDATKGDAKGPVKTQLKEVLDEPALSSAHDSKLEENLRNTGKAGVKIAAARELFQKIASGGDVCGGKGECQYCQLKTATLRVKQANAMQGYGGGGGMGGGAGAPAGGGMAAMAETGASVDGCTCGNVGECRVCKLKAALMEAAKGSGMTPGAGMPPAAPAEKGTGSAQPMGGIY